MVLAAGTRLGAYEIAGPLGVGGMGEVYRATDFKLGREVAIKTLPAALAADPDRLARFEREAKLLAALNHAHIAAIYGLDDHDGMRYIAMELVEGETLEARLKRGALPIDEALRLGVQIAEALEAAHGKGVVHRDLKPANVMITRDGVAKVLDFGLAKAFSGDSAEASPLHSPALSAAMTQQGLILGTAGYMSPEQASGQATDQRADVFAFGVLLYEMLAGLPVFSGESVPHILAAVLQTEPDWSRLPKNLHPRIRSMLERCLAKRPRNRYAGIADARVDLEAALADPRGLTAQPLVAATRPARAGAFGWGVAAVALVLAALAWFGQRAGDIPAPGVAMSILPPTDSRLAPVASLVSAPELAPDGSAILFRTFRGLYVRRLDSLTATLVPGSERSSNTPFWSADSRAVFYPRGLDTLIKVALPDGAPEAVMQLPGPSRGGSVRDDGALLVWTTGGLQWLPPGGEARTVTVAGLSGGSPLYPEFLPGTDLFIFFWVPDDGSAKGVYLASIDDQGQASDPVLLLQNDSAARYTPAGRSLLFVRDDRLYAQRLDASARRLVGDAHLVQDGVAWNPQGLIYRADFSVSRGGDVAWRPGTAALSQVTTFDRTGAVIGTSGPPLPIAGIRLSPDEARVLATGEHAWLLDVGSPGRLDLPGDIDFGLWSRDGQRLIGERSGRIVERDVGGGEVRDLGKAQLRALDLSPDGKELIGMNASFDAIQIQALDGTSDAAEVRTLVASGSGDPVTNPVFSPDGRFLLYRGDGGLLYAQPNPGPGTRRIVATVPGRSAVWRGDGNEILFASAPGVLYSVRVNAGGDALQFGEPEQLFTGLRLPPGAVSLSPLLAVSSDGSRIYWVQAAEQPASDLIQVRTRAVR